MELYRAGLVVGKRVFSHQSARVECFRIEGSSLFHAEYFGVVTNRAMSVLGPLVMEQAAENTVMMNFSRAAMPLSYDPEVMGNVCIAAAGVYVVNVEQHPIALEHCSRLIKDSGVLRTVFLDFQESLARVWAETLEVIRLQQRATEQSGLQQPETTTL